jgi:hypothetical protein
MLAKLRPHLSYANVMATVAVFIALGGGSYAAIKLPANSVGTKQLKKTAVTLKKIKRSTRHALKGQQGDTGPRGATGAAGPGASRLNWSETHSNPVATQLFSSGDGLTVSAKCEFDSLNDANKLTIVFGATGSGAKASATWTVQESDVPQVSPVQDGNSNGGFTIVATESNGTTTTLFRRLEGQAIVSNDIRIVSVAFHALVDTNGNCELDATVTPAS